MFRRCTIVSKYVQSKKHVKNIDSFKNLLTALEDDEPGIFHISTKSSLSDTKGNFQYVPAHAIILIKSFEDTAPKFRVVQIFEGEYSLNEFLEKHEKSFRYNRFEDLQDNFLQPLETLFFFGDHWGEKEEIAYEKLTKVRLDLTGIPISVDKSTTRWQIKRTTNKGLPSRASIIHAMGTLLIMTLIASIVFR